MLYHRRHGADHPLYRQLEPQMTLAAPALVMLPICSRY
jgi:hypothetical protein